MALGMFTASVQEQHLRSEAVVSGFSGCGEVTPDYENYLYKTGITTYNKVVMPAFAGEEMEAGCGLPKRGEFLR